MASHRQNVRRRRLALAATASVLSIAAGQQAQAADWDFTPIFGQSLAYEDNILLTSRNELEGWSSTTSPAFRLEGRTPRTEIDLDGQLDFVRYFNNEGLSSNNGRAHAEIRRLGERLQLALAGDFVRDTPRTSELTGTGETAAGGRHYRYEVAPSLRYQVSERGAVTVGAVWERELYAESTLTGYTGWGGNLGYSYRLSENSTADVVFNYLRYDASEPNPLVSDRYSLQAGLTREITPQFRLRGAVGGRYIVSDRGAAQSDESSTGFILSANANWHNEDTMLDLTLARTVEPAGDGGLLNQDSILFTGERQFTETMQFNLSLGYFRNSPIDGGGSTQDRNVFTIQPALHWQVHDEVELVGSYNFRRSSGGTDGTATANTFMLTLVYTGL